MGQRVRGSKRQTAGGSDAQSGTLDAFRERASQLPRCACVSQWFEDFLECLVRTALMMSLPTSKEVAEASFADAGEFMLALKAQDDYEEFAISHLAQEWWQPRQPVECAVEQLLTLIIRTIENVVTASDLVLSRKEIKKFREAVRIDD